MFVFVLSMLIYLNCFISPIIYLLLFLSVFSTTTWLIHLLWLWRFTDRCSSETRKNGLHSQNDKLKQIVLTRIIHLLYKCGLYLVLARRSQILRKVEGSNICFMSLLWSWIVFFRFIMPVDIWGIKDTNCCYCSDSQLFRGERKYVCMFSSTGRP